MVNLARRHQRQQRPRGLRRGARLALAARPVAPIRGTVFAPAAVGALLADEPCDRTPDHRIVTRDTGNVERAQYRPGAVDVIGAPAAEPRAVGQLRAPQIIEAARKDGAGIAALRQERQTARA